MITRRKTSIIKIFFSILMFMGNCGYSYQVSAVSVENDSDQLKLIPKFFSPPKYKLGSEEAKPVMKDSGLHPDFVDILSPYPQAIESANDSLSYSGVTLAGSVILMLGAAYGLIDTLDDKDDLDNNRFPENDDNQEKALGVVIVGAIISIYGNSQAQRAINRAVEIFNKNFNNKTGINLRNNQTYVSDKKNNSALVLDAPVFSISIHQQENDHTDFFALTSFTYKF